MDEPLLVTNHVGEILVFAAPLTAARAAAERINSHPIEHPIYPGVFSRFARVTERPPESRTTHVYVTFPDNHLLDRPTPESEKRYGFGVGDRVRFTIGLQTYHGSVCGFPTPGSYVQVLDDHGKTHTGIPISYLTMIAPGVGLPAIEHKWDTRDGRGNAMCSVCGDVMCHGAREYCPGAGPGRQHRWVVTGLRDDMLCVVCGLVVNAERGSPTPCPGFKPTP